MDINSLLNQSPKFMTIMENIKKDPNFLSELRDNPQDALNKIGVELNDDEWGILNKLGNLKEIEEEAEGVLNKVKSLFGFNEKDEH